MTDQPCKSTDFGVRRLCIEVARQIRLGHIDSRSPVGDAWLDLVEQYGWDVETLHGQRWSKCD